jgi:hypothetical protein
VRKCVSYEPSVLDVGVAVRPRPFSGLSPTRRFVRAVSADSGLRGDVVTS